MRRLFEHHRLAELQLFVGLDSWVVRIADENLRGKSVITADGHVIGEVATLFIETQTWQVESLRVKLRNDVADRLGAARGVFHAGTLSLPVNAVQSVGDAVVLSVTGSDLRQPRGSGNQLTPPTSSTT